MTALAVSVLLAGRRTFAYLVFGDSAESSLLVLVAMVLAAVILHHFLEAVFAGLRVFRVVSAMQFAQSMLFAAISLSLLVVWRTDEWSIVVGYGSACMISATAAVLWARRFDWHVTEETMAESHRTFWPPLLRFAVWVWVTNLLTNLFAVIDRYMIVHYSGLPADDSLGLVGHYHTSMLVPVLLVSVANLLTGAMTPHLSHQWEAGDRSGVADRIHTTLKLTALGMFATGIGVLLVTPTLFHLAFGGKYDAGLEVLPWAVASCVWFSLLLVSQTYVWCTEKTRHASMPLAIGLASNVVLNLVLLPRLGLQGAVVATALATLIALVAQLTVNRRLGMSPSPGTLLLVLTPLALGMGYPVAIAAAGLIGFVVVFTPWLLSLDERRQVVALVCQRLNRSSTRRAINFVGEG